MMSTLFKRHPVFGVHLLLMAVLCIGLVQRSGLRYLPLFSLHLLILLATYALLHRIGTTRRPPSLLTWDLNLLSIGVAIFTAGVALMHWWSIGQVPLIEALRQQDDLAVGALRRAASDLAPAWVNYAGNLAIKALLPFALLMTWSRRRSLFWVLCAVGLAYSLSLIQKSYVITLFVPLWVSFLIARKWVSWGALTGLFIVTIGFLFIVAKPEKLAQTAQRADAPVVDEGVKRYGLVGDLLWSTARRVLLMPGWTVSAWFEYIPARIPYQDGAAIRPLAAVLGMPYADLSMEVYALEYPELASLGTKGTVPTAACMYDYANFGWMGLVLAGSLHALWLILVTWVYGERWRWAVVLNVFPLLAFTSCALPTALLTHGWVATILLYLTFADGRDPHP